MNRFFFSKDEVSHCLYKILTKLYFMESLQMLFIVFSIGKIERLANSIRQSEEIMRTKI